MKMLVPQLSGLALLAFGLVVLAACGRSESPFASAPVPRSAVEPVSTQPHMNVAAPPTYVGRWAAAPSACKEGAWTISSDRLQSPGPLACTLSRPNPTVAGYTVYGVCEVGKASGPGRLIFTMTRVGGAQSLTISGGPFNEPFPLTRCAEPLHADLSSGDGQG